MNRFVGALLTVSPGKRSAILMLIGGCRCGASNEGHLFDALSIFDMFHTYTALSDHSRSRPYFCSNTRHGWVAGRVQEEHLTAHSYKNQLAPGSHAGTSLGKSCAGCVSAIARAWSLVIYDTELKMIAALKPRPAFLSVLRMLTGVVEYKETSGLLVTAHWCERNRRDSNPRSSA